MELKPSHEQIERAMQEMRCVPAKAFETRLVAHLDRLIEAHEDEGDQRGWLHRLIFRSGSDTHEEDYMPQRSVFALSAVILVLAAALFVGLVLMPEIRARITSVQPATLDATAIVEDTPTPEAPTSTDDPAPALPMGSGIPITTENAARLVELARSPQQSFDLTSIFFSPDGNTVFGTGFVWRLDTGESAPLPLREVPTDASLSPDGAQLVIATNRGVRQWFIGDLITEGGTLLRQDNVSALTFMADGSALALGCCELRGSHGVTVIDSTTGDRLWTIPFEAKVSALALSPDGVMLAVGSSDIALVDTARQEITSWLSDPVSPITALAYSADGTVLAAASTDGSIYLWDAGSGALLSTIKAHDQFAEAVALSLDGSLVASAGRDGAARLWDAVSGELLIEVRSGESSGYESWMTGVGFSPDGTLFATGGVEGWMRIFGVPES